MARYRPMEPFTVPARVLVPTASVVTGVTKKMFSEPEDSELIYCSFRTFGGNENLRDGVYTVIDTATIETWYRPDITADCRIYICDTGAIYEILGSPENINMRNQYLKFKVRKIGGKP